MIKHLNTLRWFIANGMAGFQDLCVGALVAAAVWRLAEYLHFHESVPWWYILIGSIFALAPDFDVIKDILSKTHITYDHHTTYFHRPIKFMPTTLSLVAVVGTFGVGFEKTMVWEVLAIICLLWHYLHDYPLGDGYLNWFYPFTPDKLIPNDHDVWLQEKWCKPSERSVEEIVVGIVCLTIALVLIDKSWWIFPTIFVLVNGLWVFWSPSVWRYLDTRRM